MNKNYCVYEHIFPNEKKYIGISCDAEKRWRNGKGYETQPKIARAINKYGWENVKHNIIIDEHIERLAEARLAGVTGIPSIRRLVIDAEDIADMLEKLACAVSNV